MRFFYAAQIAGLRIRITLNADPHPAFHINADPDPAFHSNADLDPYPASKNNLQPCLMRSFLAEF
jgi:hypothetical protein